jgi:hypothetical protein
MFPIEKNVPLPKPKRGRHRSWPYLEMVVGDSFLYPGNTKRRFHGSEVAHNCLVGCRRHGVTAEFMAAREGKDWRIWRTA